MYNQLHNIANLEDTTRSLSLNSVTIGSLAIIVLILLAVILKDRLKMLIFSLIAATTLVVTAILAISTVYLNVNSDSKGPVHWHADFEVWACDTEVELRNPYKFLSNKIGTPTYHEHDDKRIHIEGVVVEKEVDASLGRFFEVVEGRLERGLMHVPINPDGVYREDDIDGDQVTSADLSTFIEKDDLGKFLSFEDGKECNGNPAEVQVFVYKTLRKQGQPNTYYQQKVEDYPKYLIGEYSQVPDGDCIIFEFSSNRQTTERLCKEYGTRDKARCAEFGVTKNKDSLCVLEEMSLVDAEKIINGGQD